MKIASELIELEFENVIIDVEAITFKLWEIQIDQ